MDRFIEEELNRLRQEKAPLKSNMDRFIEEQLSEDYYNAITLKSNMDRFIVLTHKTHIVNKKL